MQFDYPWPLLRQCVNLVFLNKFTGFHIDNYTNCFDSIGQAIYTEPIINNVSIYQYFSLETVSILFKELTHSEISAVIIRKTSIDIYKSKRTWGKKLWYFYIPIQICHITENREDYIQCCLIWISPVFKGHFNGESKGYV